MQLSEVKNSVRKEYLTEKDGVRKNRLKKILTELGWSPTFCDTTFPSFWSQELAWALGWIFSKCLIRNSTFELGGCREEILLWITEILNFPYKFIGSGAKKPKIIIDCGELFIRFLEEYGLSKDGKRSGIFFPEMPKIYKRHFLRGFFEGGVSISTREQSTRIIFSSASKKMLLDIKNYLVVYGLSDTKVSEDKRENSSVYRLAYSKINDIVKLVNILYFPWSYDLKSRTYSAVSPYDVEVLAEFYHSLVSDVRLDNIDKEQLDNLCRDLNKEIANEKYPIDIPVNFQCGNVINTRAQILHSMPYKEYLKTEEWKIRSEECLKNAGYRCQVCNSTKKLNAHHRTYVRRGYEEKGDLTCLCRTCHKLFFKYGKLVEEIDENITTL